MQASVHQHFEHQIRPLVYFLVEIQLDETIQLETQSVPDVRFLLHQPALLLRVFLLLFLSFYISLQFQLFRRIRHAFVLVYSSHFSAVGCSVNFLIRLLTMTALLSVLKFLLGWYQVKAGQLEHPLCVV